MKSEKKIGDKKEENYLSCYQILLLLKGTDMVSVEATVKIDFANLLNWSFP